MVSVGNHFEPKKKGWYFLADVDFGTAECAGNGWIAADFVHLTSFVMCVWSMWIWWCCLTYVSHPIIYPMCIYIYIHMPIIHTYIYIFIYIYPLLCIYAYIYAHYIPIKFPLMSDIIWCLSFPPHIDAILRPQVSPNDFQSWSPSPRGLDPGLEICWDSWDIQ